MIHVVARSEESGNIFVSRHKSLDSVISIELGQRSYFDLLNRVIKDTDGDYACIVHDDVLLCSDFDRKVRVLVEKLSRDWPNWGLAGNAGLTPTKVGYSATKLVRYLADPHGGPNLAGQILPAMSIDGNVMLLNLRALRDKGVSVPDFDGFQLYDILLSIETISAGLGVFVAPQLACWHGSGGSQKDFDSAKSAFQGYLGSRIRNRYLETLNGCIRVDRPHAVSGGIDVEMESLRAACKDRPTRKVAIVTRTQFLRPELLDRCLRTISSFVTSAGESSQFRSYVVTDKEAPHLDCLRSSTLVKGSFGEGDTRYKLVKFAAESIEADYFWFIDDDDWMFPNEAERLGLAISAAPEKSILFVDCDQFDEMPFSGTLDNVECYKSTLVTEFPARDFLVSLSGHNRSPFCGVIFKREALLNIPRHIYDSVTYFEDFMTTLNTLLTPGVLPIVVDKLYVGISVRETGNTVTEKDRTKWNASMSELVSHLVNTEDSSQLLSLPSNMIGHEDLDAKRTLNHIMKSKSWKLTRPLRGIAKLLRGDISLKEFVSRI